MKSRCIPCQSAFALASVAMAAALASVNGAEFPSGWKNVQPVTIERAGLTRFSLPVEMIDAARPALEDLRIFDDAGREIPFDLERPVQRAAPTLAPRKTTTTVQPVATVITVETGLDRPLRAVTLQTPAREFLKAARVEGSDDGANWKVLADGVPVFTQRDGASQRRIDLAPQTWRHLRLTLDDQRSPPIPTTGLTLHADSAESAPAEPLGVEITERIEAERETLLTLRFSAANVTLAGLTVLTDEPVFSRAVALRERRLADGEAKEFTLTAGSLYRLVLPEQRAVSNLTFAVDVVAPARELILAIRNDDNPPLQISTVRAERRPVLVTLVAPAARKLHLLSGNSQCAAPRYDLAQLRGSLKTVQPAPVQSGALAANPAFRSPEPLAALALVGAPLDVAAWKFRKPVRRAGDGVQQLELDLEVLAHAAPSLADLRLMAAGKQIPYCSVENIGDCLGSANAGGCKPAP
ncbi:MAG: DUF3999 family protein [Verrucomicrobia bacterium]|nr:DUF3999 family protein [Verrucomicrobiota bacterium]